ncbi:MAG TPA: ABC transporter substrate-binding protein [Burkholderiales bacterium]|jgi:putative ABC transport system substrate-binding protein|nr:ABC transporter substrate-binding protein [Burkholderiales bacterium]
MRLFRWVRAAGLILAGLALISECYAAPPGHVVRVGLLYPISADFDPAKNPFDRELVEGLRELGYQPGRDVVFELRSAASVPSRLPGLAAELLAAKVDMVVAPATQPVLAAAAATKTVPIIMVGTSDPVEIGLIASLARPGGNVTGLAVNASETAAKRVELLREAVPGASRIAVLWNSSIRSMSLGFHMIERASPVLGVTLQSVEVSDSAKFDQAFEAIARARPDGLIVLFGPLAGDDLPRIVQFVVKQRLPTIFEVGQGVRGGGLMEFGPSPSRMARRAASYIDRIANGADPGALPVEQPTVFELTINLKAARAMGITIPQLLLLRADKIIE